MTAPRFATMGYGYHLLETRAMLDLAQRHSDRGEFFDACLRALPQKSDTNKTRMWNHLTRRYLVIAENRVQPTAFLRMYAKVQATPAADEFGTHSPGLA